ncbi:hypothetical protein JAAARDRAFT_124899 [Jaapia argillacea MUCL 33604]|uniref:P/Homo B domain-containing protein n=1 Tax=Jaapia argillacea MUCL 33604 TaxID=933084 RepID=A0A067Q4S8_9AGAM|nr:hypothetical protein JAAARDRAFT_124899 [Jaapia argillacea MUCL 33604]
MRLPLTLVLLLLAPQALLASSPAKRFYSSHDYYVLEHDPLAGASLEQCAHALGVEIVEQAGELRDHWLVRVPKHDTRISARAADSVVAAYKDLRARAESPSLSSRSEDSALSKRITSSVKYLAPQIPRQRVKRAPPSIRQEDEQNGTTSAAVAQRLGIEDPTFPQQWHLVNDEFPGNMMNVTPLWDMGIMGEGVISALVDDGLDYNSDDLAENFDPVGSYDFNDHVDLPTPTLFDDHHGTRCAGQIAAVKNNVCGVGIAFKSKVAGVRILSGPISDVDEAASLNYGYQTTSIFSCSWGPSDDGRSMEAPDYLIQKAVVNGINNGRGGKGSIYVFASGNGAQHDDQCNFDGYTNSIYSITVSAIDYKGLHPYYSESCAANMVVAYSSGSGNHIVTTDVGKDKCSTTHGGTSAAAPNAVGVFALALSVRPDLTWRDMQHLCVQTAKVVNPDDPDWENTAAGRPFSYKYGFGRLDGAAYVTAAQSWELVKPQARMRLPSIQINNGTMDADGNMTGGTPIPSGGLQSTFTVTPEMMQENNLETLEHITIRVWITHTRRGDVEVELVSPHGIKSVLAAKRRFDAANTGYPGWRFMSVKHWDESPVGDWTIRVSDQNIADQSGAFLGWGMTFWGSTIDPSKAILYDVELNDDLLPLPPAEEEAPPPPSSTIPAPSSTKSHAKPTDHLPGDHGTAEGEADKPAFPGASGTPTPVDDSTSATGSPTPTSSMTPTPDEGWFPGMGKLISNQKWFFGAVGVVALFGVSAAIFFWRRRTLRRRAQYSSLAAGDDLPMSGIQGGRSGAPPRTKELYDAFGEVSDDEYDDADEETGLRRGNPQERHLEELGFHSGFLDDEEVDTTNPTVPLYRDEPEGGVEETAHDQPVDDRSRSPGSSGSSGSGTGSWEHASQTH